MVLTDLLSGQTGIAGACKAFFDNHLGSATHSPESASACKWAEVAEMEEPPIHPMGVAMQWVARITGAAVMMILPGLAGLWLDEKWGVSFIGLIGFAFGLIGGMTYLISATRAADAERRQATRSPATRTTGDQETPHRK